MDEVMETPTPLETESEFADYTEPTPDPTPEPEPTPDFKAELEAMKKEIEKDRKNLQKGFDEIARRERELAAPKMSELKEGDDIPDLDPTAAKALKKFLDENYGGYFQTTEMVAADLFESELDTFAEKRDLDADALRSLISERGLQPRDYTRKAFRDLLNDAATLLKPVDSDALREQVREEIMRELADQGVVVEAAKPKRTESTLESGFDDEMTPEQKLAFWKRKGFI